MPEVEKFTVWRQRIILTEIADEGGRVLHTAEGAAFMEQLAAHFAASLAGIAKRWGYHVEGDELVNMIVERLLTTRERDTERCPARYAAAAEDPWGYLWKCAHRWMQDLWGHRGLPLEHAELTVQVVEEDSDNFTPLNEVIDMTFAVIAPLVEAKHHSAVFELLSWLAINPPQRLSYDLDDRVAAHRHCPSLTKEQVVAVMKIARGSRPRVIETSLMGQFLIDADFRISESGTHSRALIHFKNEFRAGAKGSRMLTDWTY